MPQVSIIIPYYNAGLTIQETIDSIINQSYSNFDIWIINDGSTDPESIEKLNEFQNLERITVLHQENAGPSLARNIAIKQTNAEFILPIDADNTIKKDALSHFINIAIKNESYDAFHGDIQFFGKKNSYFKREEYSHVKALLVSQIDTCALIRRSVFDNGLEYDAFLSKLGLEDWEFWINFHKIGFKSLYINYALFNMRVEYSSRTYLVANKNLDIIREYVFKKHIGYFAENYKNLFYEKKQLLETPDYRIGSLILHPYRLLKKIVKKWHITLRK